MNIVAERCADHFVVWLFVIHKDCTVVVNPHHPMSIVIAPTFLHLAKKSTTTNCGSISRWPTQCNCHLVQSHPSFNSAKCHQIAVGAWSPPAKTDKSQHTYYCTKPKESQDGELWRWDFQHSILPKGNVWNPHIPCKQHRRNYVNRCSSFDTNFIETLRENGLVVA